MSVAEVQRGVCTGHREGLPYSVFLSEIFEWDQTVIRSKPTQKHTSTHSCAHACAQTITRTSPSSLAAGREGWVQGNGVAPMNGATPEEVSRNSPLL